MFEKVGVFVVRDEGLMIELMSETASEGGIEEDVVAVLLLLLFEVFAASNEKERYF
jgi:hypothetical protein